MRFKFISDYAEAILLCKAARVFDELESTAQEKLRQTPWQSVNVVTIASRTNSQNEIVTTGLFRRCLNTMKADGTNDDGFDVFMFYEIDNENDRKIAVWGIQEFRKRIIGDILKESEKAYAAN